MQVWAVEVEFAATEKFILNDIACAGGFAIRRIECAHAGEASELGLAMVRELLTEMLGEGVASSLRFTCRQVPWKDDHEEKLVFHTGDDDDSFASRVECLRKIGELWERQRGGAVAIEDDGTRLRLVPEGAPEITVDADGLEYTVTVAWWHGHADDPREVWAWLHWLQSAFYRFVRETRDGEMTATWLEKATPIGWEPRHEAIYGDAYDRAFWEQKGDWVRTYLQVDTLEPPEPPEGVPVDEHGLPPGSLLGEHSTVHERSAVVEFDWLSNLPRA